MSNEEQKVNFAYDEVVRALLKEKNIREGRWMITIEFGLGATMIGPNESNLRPAAILPIVSIGLTKTEQVSNLSVDASTVSPSAAKAVPTRKKRAVKKASARTK